MGPQPKLARLCSHARIKQFKCGDERFDFNLKSYQERFIDGDETCVFTLETQMRAVVGYVSTYDLIRRAGNRQMRWFCIPAFAVEEGSQGTNYAARLANHAYHVATLRQSVHAELTGKPRYDAIACANWTDDIEEVLESLHFHSTQPGVRPAWWLRPLPIRS